MTSFQRFICVALLAVVFTVLFKGCLPIAQAPSVTPSEQAAIAASDATEASGGVALNIVGNNNTVAVASDAYVHMAALAAALAAQRAALAATASAAAAGSAGLAASATSANKTRTAAATNANAAPSVDNATREAIAAINEKLERAARETELGRAIPPAPPFNSQSNSRGSKPPPVQGPASAAFGSAMDKLLGGLKSANIAFNVPSPMNIDDTRKVVLELDFNKTGSELASEITEVGKKLTDTVSVAETMTAHLKGDDFTITPLAAETQSPSYTRTTTWMWEVKPKTFGTLALYLTLDADFATKEETRHWHIQTFSKEIKVKVWPASVEGAEKFVASNWQWLWTALLVPVGVWAYAWFRRKKADDVPI